MTTEFETPAHRGIIVSRARGIPSHVISNWSREPSPIGLGPQTNIGPRRYSLREAVRINVGHYLVQTKIPVSAAAPIADVVDQRAMELLSGGSGGSPDLYFVFEPSADAWKLLARADGLGNLSAIIVEAPASPKLLIPADRLIRSTVAKLHNFMGPQPLRGDEAQELAKEFDRENDRDTE